MRSNLPIQELRMVAKILCLLSSSSSVKDKWLKCLKKRGVTELRPPPGGPMAHSRLMSTSSRNVPRKSKVKALYLLSVTHLHPQHRH